MLTGVERISNILNKKPVDRIGLFEHFWNDTHKAYVEQGHIKAEESFENHFGLDMQLSWTYNLMADIEFEEKIVAETEDTKTILDGNGAYLKRHKHHDTTPEHVDFTVKDRESWEKYKPMLLEPDERRINFEGYRNAKEDARRANRYFAP